VNVVNVVGAPKTFLEEGVYVGKRAVRAAVASARNRSRRAFIIAANLPRFFLFYRAASTLRWYSHHHSSARRSSPHRAFARRVEDEPVKLAATMEAYRRAFIATGSFEPVKHVMVRAPLANSRRILNGASRDTPF
jgi:hypothetical protein